MSTFGSIDGVVNKSFGDLLRGKPGLRTTRSTISVARCPKRTICRVTSDITQLAVKQMLAQKTGGSVIAITTAMVEHPIAGVNCSVAMITKGGLEAITRSLAMEYAKDGIRFNAVAPGIVDTPMHASNPHEFLKTLSPMGMISDVDDIVEAIVYLTEARHVTGEVLHVDAGAHNGKW